MWLGFISVGLVILHRSTHYPASAGLNWPCCLTGVQGWIFCVHPEDLGGLLPQGQQIFVPLNVGEIASTMNSKRNCCFTKEVSIF